MTWNPEQHVNTSPDDRESDSLHEAVQEHINSCRQCQEAIKNKPRGFMQKGLMCQTYFAIVGGYKPPERTMHDA